MIALTPHAQYALELVGVAHRWPEDYYAEDELDSLGVQELERVERVCATLDLHVRGYPSVYREHDLCPGTLNWYNLKVLLNSAVVHLFLADRMLARERPAEVVCFGTREEPIPRDLWFVRESVWSGALALACRARGIPCTVLPPAATDTALRAGARWDPRSLLRRALGKAGYGRLRRLYRRARALRRTRGSRARRDRRARENVRCVVMLDVAYSLGLLAREIRRHRTLRVLYWNPGEGDPPIFLDEPLRSIRLDRDPITEARARADSAKLWELLPRDEFATLFDLNGMNFFPLVERRLRHFFLEILPDMLRVDRAATTLFQRFAPVAVVGAAMGQYANQVVARATRRSGIPGVVYKHGASAGYVWMEGGQAARDFGLVSWRNDIRPADVHLVNGEGDRRYYERYFPGPTRNLPVGSAHLDALRRGRGAGLRARLCRRYGMDPNRKVVVYVPMVMDGTVRVIPYNNRSPGWMFEMERAFVNVFREFPEIQFVIKLLRSPVRPLSPIAELIRREKIANCRVITEPFGDILPLGDLFVLDFPSTIFLEALTTDRPVLLCGHRLPWKWMPGVWEPAVLEMWRERVAYADDLDEFLELLRRHLKEERFAAVRSSDTLLKLFGTHLDDGKSAERAYRVLQSLHSGGPRGAPGGDAAAAPGRL